jgi:CubicO group peptidase (beta-lactamase class C family)
MEARYTRWAGVLDSNAMRSPMAMTGRLVGLCIWCAGAVGCGGSARPSATADGSRAEADAPGQVPSRPRDERRLDPRVNTDNVQARLSPYIDSIGAGFGPGHQASGFVTLSAGGDVIYERAFGHADVKADEDNASDTSFRIGAISAQFTAAAVLRLARDKKLRLEDPVGKFIPDYPAAGAAITVHQLLSHTSGLPNYLTVPGLAERRTQKLAPQELLALFWSEPLEFEPGTDFGYSDSDYVVLGIIIERVSGQSYAEHMREELFEPFDLDDTSVGSTGSADDAARGYKASESGQLEPVQGFDDSILYAAAGIRSTARDLLTWHDALQEGQVFDEKYEALSLRVVKNHYAYGWFVREQRGHTVVSHPGALEGFASEFSRIPDLDLAIVVLMNNASVDATRIADAALGIALGEKLEPLPKQTGVAVDASVPARITGTYRLSEAAAKQLEQRKIPKRALLAMRSVRVYQDGETLYFKPSGQAAVAMVATGRSSFVLVGGKAKIEVPLDPGDAPATRLLLEQGPLQVEFTRRARQRGKPETSEEDAEEDAETDAADLKP